MPSSPDPFALLCPVAPDDLLRVPKLVFQTWKSKIDIPANFQYWRSTLKDFNPAHALVLWDDADNHAFIATSFPWFLETYEAYPQEIFRADAIRYFFLYAFGGLYADMDVECLCSIDDLSSPDYDVLLGRMGSDPENPHSVPNAIMASKPRQEFWLLLMRVMMNVLKRQKSPEWATGPALLKTCLDLYNGPDQTRVREAIESTARLLPEALQPSSRLSNIRLLPGRTWFPLDWTDPLHQRIRRQVLEERLLTEEEKRELFPWSSFVTYWTHSW